MGRPRFGCYNGRGIARHIAMSWGMRKLFRMRWCDRFPVGGLLVLALAIAGCTAGGGFSSSTTPPADASPSFSDKFKNFFSNSSAKSPQAATGAKTDVYCPFIEIRQGASTLSIGPPGDNAAMTLKYQGTFVRAARECSVVGTELVMKIGVQGRVIVGPAGGPGDVVVPLRIAVVHETTAGSQTVTTKLIRIPVSVAPGASYSEFTHIEEGVAFPLPSPATIEDYTVYIGFDPLALEAQDKKAAKPKPNPRAKPKPAERPVD
jgi:hypothetical protein